MERERYIAQAATCLKKELIVTASLSANSAAPALFWPQPARIWMYFEPFRMQSVSLGTCPSRARSRPLDMNFALFYNDYILKISKQKQKGGKAMEYSKPVILAQNDGNGSFAAGCPEKGTGGPTCKRCERTK